MDAVQFGTILCIVTCVRPAKAKDVGSRSTSGHQPGSVFYWQLHEAWMSSGRAFREEMGSWTCCCPLCLQQERHGDLTGRALMHCFYIASGMVKKLQHLRHAAELNTKGSRLVLPCTPCHPHSARSASTNCKKHQTAK